MPRGELLLPVGFQMKDLRDKFFETVDPVELVKEEGLKLVKAFLDKELGEDDLEKQVRTWFEFENCQRGDKEIEDFISDFDRAYQKAAKASGSQIPSQVRAFMVLKRSNINQTQQMLVMSKLDKEKKDQMFENICKELKLVLGGGPGTVKEPKLREAAIKVEAADIPSEDVLLAHGYVKRDGGGYRGGRGGRGGGRGRGG